jgi:hypothetical protein
MGIGTATCLQFATEYRADAGIEQRFFDWAQGLMSGINDALEDNMGKYRDLNSMPIAQQKEILRAYCVPKRNQCPNQLPDNCAFGTPTALSTPAITAPFIC